MSTPGQTMHDMVQQITTDERFRQLQKLEAVGRLAGGVAHDFNNLLTIIMGCCQILQQKHAEDNESCGLLKEIGDASDRAALLTRQLLLFSRKENPKTEVVNLNEVISKLVRILRRLIGDNIELQTDLDSNLGHVQVDPGQIEQVIMNLVINARDAMPKGGRLRIETHNRRVESANDSDNAGVPPGQWTTLVVRDSGCGMSDEVLDHLFEPFFTTKEIGKGTGLGLATVFGVVSQYRGHICVASKLGVGTRFRIYLPQVAAVRVAGDKKPNPSEPRTGKETILLVEDDQSLRKLAANSLRNVGYQVLEASHGGEALSLAGTRSHPIALVITDVIMPIVSGPQLATKLLHRLPKLKVLYMSGYTDSLLAPHDEQDIRGNFLQKPFTPSELIATVQRVLAPTPC